MATQGPMSGFRDILPDQMIPRQAMLGTIARVYEIYGFTPLKTPALERFSTLSGKYGEEGEKLLYKFEDNGGRMVALRYDQSVPLARVVAQYGSQLPSPYKRYVIGEAWRGERSQAGRYREFTQVDADIIGSASPAADAEVLAMTVDAFAALGAKAIVRVNDRRLLDVLTVRAGAKTEAKARQLIGTLDKIDKIGKDEVLKLVKKDFGDKTYSLVREYLSLRGANRELLQRIASLLGPDEKMAEAIANLAKVFEILAASGYGDEQVSLDPTIARGLDYYTGIIFEANLVGAEELGSVSAGGRYDKLVKTLGGPDAPAVGTSIGVDRLMDGLAKLGKVKASKTNTLVLVTNFEAEDEPQYMSIASGLRQNGIPTEVYYDQAKLGKQVGYADKMGIPYVVLAGPDELAKNSVIIKTLDSGEQKEVALDKLLSSIKSLD